MDSLLATKFCNFMFFLFLLLVSTAAISVSAHQFPVGGDRGWIKPTGNETETYDEWATKTRFHVGDSLSFKYQNDSVLVVNYTDYNDCVVSNPILKFNDGKTVYRFDRYGFFYFISGEPGHCKSGQKLVIRVMVQSGEESPRSAPSPGAGGGGPGGKDGGSGDKGGGSGGGDEGGSGSFEWGPPSINSTIKQTVASYFMTALGGMMVILYLFI